MIDAFRRLYGSADGIRVFRAPGRVNLIGEHTDYNLGFVLPVALDLATYIATAPAAGGQLRIHSEDREDSAEWPVAEIATLAPRRHWTDYPIGVAQELIRAGFPVAPANLLIRSTVPEGSGLSSSAALEVSTAWALLSNSEINVDRNVIPQMCQQAEHLYPETKCGIMDQFISCHGRAGHALMLDCRSLDFQLLPLPGDVRLMVCNTMVRHEHASGGYNTRQGECQEGLRALQQALPEIRALRDVTIDELEQHRSRLSPLIYKRIRHVVTENERVKMAASALQAADMAKLGELMADSHRSLRDDYEVSTPELDLMVELARDQKDVYGARMTGGGFGGCTINLVHSARAGEVQQRLEQNYEAKTGLSPTIIICEASDGAGAVAKT